MKVKAAERINGVWYVLVQMDKHFAMRVNYYPKAKQVTWDKRFVKMADRLRKRLRMFLITQFPAVS